MNLAISFLATLGILGIVFSIIAIDSFAQSEFTAVTPQPQIEFSFMANATINNGDDVINAINTGTSVSTLNADGTFRGEGQGILRTEGGEVATWTNHVVGNFTSEGTIITRGVGFWSTPPTTGELAFMNDMITVFEVQIDMEGNLSAREWEWR
jgi:hypothetical protein